MRVRSDSVGSALPASRSSEPSASESSAFESSLERKSEERRTKNSGEKSSGRGPEDDGKPSLTTSPVLLSPLRDMVPSAAAKPSAAPEVRDLDGLVQEILVVAGPGRAPLVEVQFHSSTLEGLNVQVSKTGDEISIRFLTSSASVAQLLSQKSDQLSQGLEAKGLQVATIQVELTQASPRFTDSRPSSSDSRRGRGDQRQQRQKQ